jgi:hypothetical protein
LAHAALAPSDLAAVSLRASASALRWMLVKPARRRILPLYRLTREEIAAAPAGSVKPE